MKSRRLLLLVGLTAASVALSGCAGYFQKPWGKGTYIPAAVCALAGAGAGIGIQEARRGESTAVLIQNDGSVVESTTRDDADYWKGAIPGALIGAVLCGAAGHYFLDPEQKTPVPPPAPTPKPELPPAASKKIVLRGVNFDFDKQVIRPDSEPLLNAAIRILDENPNVRITVEGHTDALGTDAYNEALSIRRAETVYQYLRKGGIESDRMQVIGYGESRPLATNETAEGRAENRRVELRVVADDAPAEPQGAETNP